MPWLRGSHELAAVVGLVDAAGRERDGHRLAGPSGCGRIVWKAWPPKPASHSGRCGWSQSAALELEGLAAVGGPEDRAGLGAGVHDVRRSAPGRQLPDPLDARRPVSSGKRTAPFGVSCQVSPRSSERQTCGPEPARRGAGQQPRPVAAGVDQAGVDLLHGEVRAGPRPVPAGLVGASRSTDPCGSRPSAASVPLMARTSSDSLPPGDTRRRLTRWPARDSSLPASPPVWLVVVGILSVQFGAGVAKNLFDEVTPTTMVWLRLATSAVVLAARSPGPPCAAVRRTTGGSRSRSGSVLGTDELGDLPVVRPDPARASR